MNFFFLHMHLSFPTLNALFFLPLSAVRSGFFCSIHPCRVSRGLWSTLEKGTCPTRRCWEAALNRALEGRRHTRAAAARPPSSSSPHIDMVLVKYLPRAPFRSPGGAQDIGKSCHNHSHAPCVQASSQARTSAASGPSLPLCLQQSHLSRPSRSRHAQENNVWPRRSVDAPRTRHQRQAGASSKE